MTLSSAITIKDLRDAARRRLPRLAFDFIEGGVEDERCLVRNEEAFAQYHLLPRYFVDISQRSQKTSLFDRSYDSPFGICPTGTAGLWRANADEMLAEAASGANVPFLLSCASNISLKTAMQRAPGNIWFQLYGVRDRTIGERMLGHARDAGIETLVVTADVPVLPNRERNMRNGFSRPLRLTPSIIRDVLTHPLWLADYIRAGARMPMMYHYAPFAEAGASSDKVADLFSAQIPASDHGWDVFEKFRALWPRKLVVKGILHPADARRALDLGADGIIVSNHGGRQLDFAPSPIEMLPAICAEVGDKMTVMLDSGVRRGSDILVALCLGAQFVFVGRATLYGVAAYGRPGVSKAIEILRREIDINMGQLGCTDIAALGPHLFAHNHTAPVGDASQARPSFGRRLGIQRSSLSRELGSAAAG
jgi:(S)-mandelate dehydrogenase